MYPIFLLCMTGGCKLFYIAVAVDEVKPGCNEPLCNVGIVTVNLDVTNSLRFLSIVFTIFLENWLVKCTNLANFAHTAN